MAGIQTGLLRDSTSSRRQAQGHFDALITPAEGLEQKKDRHYFFDAALFASKWPAEPGATLTSGPKITIPYNPLLFNKINYPKPTIKDLLSKAEKYESELLKAKAVPGIFYTKAGLVRKLRISKARMTQIMNLLKLAPEIREYLNDLNDPSPLNYFNEKRLRPIASIKDKQKQLAKFADLKRKFEV